MGKEGKTCVYEREHQILHGLAHAFSGEPNTTSGKLLMVFYLVQVIRTAIF